MSEEKIAGSYFKDDSDIVDAVIAVSLDDGEITISVADASIMICMQKEDIERVLGRITDQSEK